MRPSAGPKGARGVTNQKRSLSPNTLTIIATLAELVPPADPHPIFMNMGGDYLFPFGWMRCFIVLQGGNKCVRKKVKI